MSDAPLDVSKLLQSVLRHDKKLNTFKMALIRALNDTALNFAALHGRGHGVAVPLRVLAEWWIGYYWPFMDTDQPVMQGPCVVRDGMRRQDVAFRQDLTELKNLWRQTPFGSNRPSDGAVLVSEMKANAETLGYSSTLLRKYAQTLRVVAKCIEQPITYSGGAGEQYAVFSRQKRLAELSGSVVPLPGSSPNELCVVISDEMWEGFKHYSIFIDALCIHEWSVFTENASQQVAGVSRGSVYQALTDRPDNRRPLTWERNQIDLLLLDGEEIRCVWTAKKLTLGGYEIDHVIPVSTYPINELWNLVPSDPTYNKHVKRARMPADDWRDILPQRLTETYGLYDRAPNLHEALLKSARLRFTAEQMTSVPKLADSVTNMVFSVADSKNTPRFRRPN